MKPVFDESGALAQTIVAIQDITDLKTAEAQLRQAQKMEAVGQLTGGIAHDFNNLLAIMLGNLELLESELDRGSESGEWVQRAIGAAERGAKLTQRLLAFSRQQALRPEPVDVDNLVRGLLDLLRRTLGETIDVELVSDAGLWLCDVDRAQLENAILNLAINARDAMGEGGRLTIETSNARIDDEYTAAQADVSPGQYVLVAVSDTGTGMPDEIIDHVFEPFFTTKGVGEGSGLGLSMVFGFIKQSSGHVKIYSEEGRGSTVKLYLPRSSEAGEVRREPDAEGLSAEAQNAVVLVVEDDADLRRLIVQMLRSLNYATLESGSGEEALVVLRGSTRVDLLLTDLVLPGGISGRDLGEEAQRARSGIRVLFMSGYAENAIIHQGRLDEGVNFLQKPFRIVTVARAIRKMLGVSDG
jgi:nitrogen-specific signal transduction histidine kinase/CheY-like chemotaxis protein